MFYPSGKKPPKGSPKESVAYQMRDTVWGDAPMEAYPPTNARALGETWSLFIKARSLIAGGNNREAMWVLRSITDLPNLTALHYLQAWHFLRQFKQWVPPERANIVYGVVVEAALPSGLDLMVAYRDGSARFWSSTGESILWDRPDSRLDKPIQILIEAGQKAAERIGSGDHPRPPLPAAGQLRFTMLTPGGKAFVEGAEAQLIKDATNKGLLIAAAELLTRITHISTAR